MPLPTRDRIGALAAQNVRIGTLSVALSFSAQSPREISQLAMTLHSTEAPISVAEFGIFNSRNRDMIEKHSQSLHLVSREAGWNVLATPTYLRLSEDFRATTTQLERAAEKKNLDAVGLAYVKLSISCIECHRYARKEMPRIGMKPRKLDGIVSK